MVSEVKMPQMSDTMHSGKILEWQKKEGEAVARGDILAVVETDKANLEIEAFAPGTLLKIAVPAGSTASVGDTIAFVGNPGESVPAAGSKPAEAEEAPKAPQAAAADPAHSSANGHQERSIGGGYAPARGDDGEGRIKASPLARKIASQRNIDLSALQGSGPSGRIVRRDVEAASTSAQEQPQRPVEGRPASQPSQPVMSRPAPSTPPQAPGSGTLTPYSKMRETIARRMQESVTQSPHFYTTTSIEMSEAKRLREALKEEPQFKGISYNHLVIKAAAYALRREPRVNRAARNDQVYQPAEINIGIITAIEDGLLIPVLRNADRLSLKDLIFEARAAIDRVRAGRPTANDLTGGTFSISNMGMFDVENFTAIINPGQGAVLAVSSILEEPIVRNGQIVPGLKMRATLSVDHRVIDGVMSATFLQHFKRALELPALLLLEEE